MPHVVWSAALESCYDLLSVRIFPLSFTLLILQTHRHLVHGRVIELGAGSGLAGFVAGHVAGPHQHVLTDGEQVLNFIRFSSPLTPSLSESTDVCRPAGGCCYSQPSLPRGLCPRPALGRGLFRSEYCFLTATGFLAIVGPADFVLATDVIYGTSQFIAPLLATAAACLTPGGTLYMRYRSVVSDFE